ncbi:MAG TPA: FG-GAP-like repeat-containing protein [Puia sp.]|nr:FG-GAP-like repeat-containing protein [Puia sp.]
MKANIRILIVASSAILLITTVSYTYIKKHNLLREETRLYEAGLRPVRDKDNPFYPEAALVHYDSAELMTTNTMRQAMVIQFLKAFTLVKLGQEKKAVEIFRVLVEKTKDNRYDRLYYDAQRELALAYLRMGERNNCISNHSSGSCIFPIKGSGVYTDPYASQKSIEVFQDILTQSPADLESRWLLNIAYMTIGAYPGKVPAAWLIPGLDTDDSAFRLKAFQDVSGDLKLNQVRGEAGGSIADDFNNDGYIDLITSSWDLEESMHYYRNNADGTFTDVSNESGLSKIKGGLNLIQADYNNDGFTDILVLRGAWLGEFGKQPNTLLRNNGDGTFTDVTVESGILSFHPTQTATWADFNNDGWVDLFIGNETLTTDHPHPSELYMNNKDGTFTNVSAEAGCQEIGFMKGVTSSDYNKDGWPDIFISCRDGKKILLKNKGVIGPIPQFEDATHAAGLDKEMTFTFPTWFFDYDNDGWPDIFVCGYKFPGSLALTAAAEGLNLPVPEGTSSMYLYHNNHDGTFTDVAKGMGLDHAVFAMGANFGDLDNDGWPDMYLGTGNPDFTSLVPNKLYRNIGGQKFADVTSSARVGNLQKGHGVAFADIDNDGDQDIFVRIGGAYKGDGYFNSLYMNPGQSSNNWISVQLEGTKSNRSAIGAHISVSFREDSVKRTVYMDVNSGGSFGGNPFRKEIGIGQAKIIDELTIKWPTTGIVQVFKNITPGQFLKIKEGNDQPEKMKLSHLEFRHPHEMNMKMISCVPVR